MISVFGYNEHYAGGSVSDLIALLNNHGGGSVDVQGNLLPDVLARVLQAAENPRYDFVTVMHLRADGTPGRTEYWRSRYGVADIASPANQVRVNPFTVYELQSREDPLPEASALAYH